MPTILLEPPTHPDTMPQPDTAPRDQTCPVCGSSSTYQIMGGGWGCVSCGSTWA